MIRKLLFILLFAASVSAQQLTPEQIIRKIDETERVSSSEFEMQQTILTSSGKKRTLQMRGYSKNKNEKQLSVYTSPARIKGDKILMLNDGDDIWFYTPKTDRVRHLASHAKRQKVQGSDFSYEDMAGGSLEEDYDYQQFEDEEVEGVKCYKFELIPTESGPHYSKLTLWAVKDKFVTKRVDYYENDELLKRLIMTDIQNIDGRWTPMKMTMTNLQDGGETTLETLKIKFDVALDDKIFSTNALKRR